MLMVSLIITLLQLKSQSCHCVRLYLGLTINDTGAIMVNDKGDGYLLRKKQLGKVHLHIFNYNLRNSYAFLAYIR